MKQLITLAMMILSVSVSAQKTYIQCGRLIDGFANTARPSATIVVEGNQIIGIENGYTSGG
ncbi:MAG: amidohydrolase family protein, partial [Bacteroidota bacterium]|nr:amidohydrolase family protein [Bacteroidota bacterium]